MIINYNKILEVNALEVWMGGGRGSVVFCSVCIYIVIYTQIYMLMVCKVLQTTDFFFTILHNANLISKFLFWNVLCGASNFWCISGLLFTSKNLCQTVLHALSVMCRVFVRHLWLAIARAEEGRRKILLWGLW